MCAMQLNIQIQRAAEPLDQRYRASADCLFRIAGLFYQIRGALV